MGEKQKHLTGPLAIVPLLGIEIIVYALFLALILVPGGVIMIIELILLVAAGFYLRRNPALGARIRELFRANITAAWIGGIVLVLLIPFFVASSPYWLFTIIIAGLFLTACLGLNLQLGSTGMVNLASAAFYAVGAYTAGLLALRLGWPAWLTVLAGALMAGLFSALLFIPVLKTKGHYLALVTIAFQFMVTILLDNQEWTGGPQGLKNIPLFSIAGYSFNNSVNLGFIELPGYANFFYLMLLMVAAVGIASQRIYNSWVGVTLSTIRDDEIAAQTFGVQVNRWKLVIFSLGNCFIGLAGAFYAHLVGFISPPNFTFEKSLVMVSIVILGGMDNVFGIVLGSLLLIILPEKLRAVQEYRFLIYGLVLIIMLIYRPKGLLPFVPRDYMELVKKAGPKKAEGGA
ncbi:MAG: high-affinity branched-chain amino acid ABC transporter permease LivM [Anaerolineae bacterium]